MKKALLIKNLNNINKKKKSGKERLFRPHTLHQNDRQQLSPPISMHN